jgi:hypothetical protein
MFYRYHSKRAVFVLEISFGLLGLMVFSATFTNISVISWRSVLLVDDPEKTTGLLPAPKKKVTILILGGCRWFKSPKRGRRGPDRIVVGFITAYAISAYHH